MQLQCQTTAGEIRLRYITRAINGERHPGHHDSDAETLTDLDVSLSSGRHEPLDLKVPLIRVDTTNGYAPSLQEIRAFIVRTRSSD